MFNPIEKQRLFSAIPPTGALASTGTVISLKNIQKAYAVVYVTNTSSHTIIATPYQQTGVASTDAKVFANTLNIWTSSSDGVLRKSSAATTFTFAVTTTPDQKMAIFEIDMGQMDLANGFDCLSIQVTASSSLATYAALYAADMRYGQAVTPSVIIN